MKNTSDREEAFEKLKTWITRDITYVPEWMSRDKLFIKKLATISTPEKYKELICKFGARYICTTTQVQALLTEAQISTDIIIIVKTNGKLIRKIVK